MEARALPQDHSSPAEPPKSTPNPQFKFDAGRDRDPRWPAQPQKHAYPYYMVWGPKFRPPMRRYVERSDAETEAARLAETRPGWRYYVLQVCGSAKVEPNAEELRGE